MRRIAKLFDWYFEFTRKRGLNITAIVIIAVMGIVAFVVFRNVLNYANNAPPPPPSAWVWEEQHT